MHGRLKIKSTAQQKAEREEAQRRKLAAYRTAFSEAMNQRSNGTHDKDALMRVGAVLDQNPDVGVLWIFRREIFQKMSLTMPSEEYQAILETELEFIVSCLRTNPKSYFTWHHRCWVLLNAPTPNWERELALCTRFLSLDERNFHCWDYRRWLVQQMGVCAEKELEFVTTKLYENFSNFSAWHYRSRLIPKAVGGDGAELCLPKNVLMEELDLVRNALFVDPTDQSPWFYHRWLLSNCTDRRVLLHSLQVLASSSTLTVAFSRAVPLSVVKELSVFVAPSTAESSAKIDESHRIADLAWAPVKPRKASAVWTAKLPLQSNLVHVTVQFGTDLLTCEMRDGETEATGRTDGDPNKFFASPADLKVSSLITSEVDSIRELYSMEPSSKWVVLGLCSLLRITTPSDSEEEVCALLEKLGKSDPLRSAFYVDFRSRVLAENQIIRCFQSASLSFSLANRGLTALKCAEWLAFIRELDLSDNELRTLPDDCCYLLRLSNLRLDGNRLSSLRSLAGLPSLQVLSAQRNALEQFEEAKVVLVCPVLEMLNLRGNAVANAEFASRLAPELELRARPLQLCV